MADDNTYLESLALLLENHWPGQYTYDREHKRIYSTPVKFLRENTGLSGDVSKRINCVMTDGGLDIILVFSARSPGVKLHQEHATEVMEILQEYMQPIQCNVPYTASLLGYDRWTTTDGVAVMSNILIGQITCECRDEVLENMSAIAYLISNLHSRENQYYIDGVGVVSERQAIQHYDIVGKTGWSGISLTPVTNTLS